MSFGKPRLRFGILAAGAAAVLGLGGAESAQTPRPNRFEAGAQSDPLKTGSKADVIAMLKTKMSLSHYDPAIDTEAWRPLLGPFVLPDEETRNVSRWPTAPARAKARGGMQLHVYMNAVRLSRGRVLTPSASLAATVLGSMEDWKRFSETGINLAVNDRILPEPYDKIPALGKLNIAAQGHDRVPVTVLGYRRVAGDEDSWEPGAHHGVAVRLASNKALMRVVFPIVAANIPGGTAGPQGHAMVEKYLSRCYILPLDLAPNLPEAVYGGAPVITTAQNMMPKGASFAWFGIHEGKIDIGGVPALLLEGPEALQEIIND